MILRHAAALALVGWYLMVPPVSSGKRGYQLRNDAPLGQWEILGSFDSADECTEVLRAHRETQDKEEKKALQTMSEGEVPKGFNTGRWGQSLYAQCIATDDPRLKDK